MRCVNLQGTLLTMGSSAMLKFHFLSCILIGLTAIILDGRLFFLK